MASWIARVYFGVVEARQDFSQSTRNFRRTHNSVNGSSFTAKLEQFGLKRAYTRWQLLHDTISFFLFISKLRQILKNRTLPLFDSFYSRENRIQNIRIMRSLKTRISFYVTGHSPRWNIHGECDSEAAANDIWDWKQCTSHQGVTMPSKNNYS